VRGGAIGADDAARAELRRLAFAAAYRQGDYATAVRYGSKLMEAHPDADVGFFVRLARAYFELGRARDAGQSLLTLVAPGASGPFQDPAVIAASFRVYRDLATDGSAGDGLAFLRQYQRSMPGTVAGLRSAYADSIAVFDTRNKLGRGFAYWQDANYPEVIRFFKEMLSVAALSPEQKVLCREFLAAAYYAFGRKQEAAEAFGGIYRIRPDFDLDVEIGPVQRGKPAVLRPAEDESLVPADAPPGGRHSQGRCIPRPERGGLPDRGVPRRGRLRVRLSGAGPQPGHRRSAQGPEAGLRLR
jgi:tetratricopeptide (TPR) repeat protein